eukprot:1161749-Pelagomonas_calceolata.AAC.5
MATCKLLDPKAGGSDREPCAICPANVSSSLASWYLKTNCNEYWLGDVEAALKPHPVVMLSPL